MPPVLPGATQRFYYLDSARGLAALSVITWHFIAAVTNIDTMGEAVSSPLHFFWYGQADVVFFFIHSGFILAYSYTGISKPLSIAGYIRFLIERIFRIYPLFIFILLISFILHSSIFPVGEAAFTSRGLHEFWQPQYKLPDVLKESILFIAIPKDGNLRLIPQDWTLTVELVVGALIPFMGFLAQKNKWVYWPVIFIAIVVLRMNTYIFEFAAGVFLFYQWDAIRQLWKKMNLLLKWLTAVAAVVLYCCFFQFPSLFNTAQVLFRPGIDRFIVASGCCLFFGIIISASSAQKILSNAFLVKIGRVCYSIYLVHMVLLICFADYLLKMIHRFFSIGHFNALILAFVVFITATILISLVTYAVIEKPFNKLGKKISRMAGRYLPGPTT